MNPEPEKAEVSPPLSPQVSPPAPPPSDAELADLRKKAAERDEFQAKMMRALADYQNLQKRIFREHAQIEEERTRETLGKILAPLDDLDRVLATAGAEPKALVEGVRLAQKGFLKALAECGVEPIETAGKNFNPQEHESVGQEPAAGKTPGTILREVARGYRFRGRTLRPARVLLVAAPQKETGDGTRGTGSMDRNPKKIIIWKPGDPE